MCIEGLSIFIINDFVDHPSPGVCCHHLAGHVAIGTPSRVHGATKLRRTVNVVRPINHHQLSSIRRVIQPTVVRRPLKVVLPIEMPTECSADQLAPVNSGSASHRQRQTHHAHTTGGVPSPVTPLQPSATSFDHHRSAIQAVSQGIVLRQLLSKHHFHSRGEQLQYGGPLPVRAPDHHRGGTDTPLCTARRIWYAAVARGV